jgi:tetratricopeptide (TPR) repeat protein
MTELNVAELQDKLKLLREQKDIGGEIATLRSLGSAFQKNRQFTKAVSCLGSALKLSQNNTDLPARAVLHAHLGCACWEMAQLKKAMTHFQSALEILKQFPDRAGRAGLLTLMGISCWRKCQWEEGLTFFEKVCELRQADAQVNTPEQANIDFYFFPEALERAVVTLENRVRLGREQGGALKILQPLFALIPLYLFTARKSETDVLLSEAASLADKLQKKGLQGVILRLKVLIARW